jgi:hypothetical protein
MKLFKKNYKTRNGFLRENDGHGLREAKLYIFNTGLHVVQTSCYDKLEVTPLNEHVYTIAGHGFYKEFVAID